MMPNNLPVHEDDLRAWSLAASLARVPLVICAVVALVALGGHGGAGAPPHTAVAFGRVVEGLVIALSAWGSW